jgi:F0F1-type ATP synthase membrane subunit b/b'
MNAPEVIDEKGKLLVVTAKTFLEGLKTMLCRTPHEYQQVSVTVSDIKAKWNEIEGYRVKSKAQPLEDCRKVDEFYGPILKFLKQAEFTVKKLQTDYETEQERIAREKQRQLDEQARKEREDLEARAKYLRDKADKEAAELREQAEKARLEGKAKEANKLLVKAATTVQKSEVKAEEALVSAAAVFAPKVHVEIPVIQGQHTKNVCMARVVDVTLVPDAFKIINDALLQKYAKSTEGKIPLPGVEFYWEKSRSVRA